MDESQKWQLLETLAETEGFEDAEEMLGLAACDSIVPAICTECEATYELEPDVADDPCEVCGSRTVQSCLILAEVI